jgi:hypothetical protein
VIRDTGLAQADCRTSGSLEFQLIVGCDPSVRWIAGRALFPVIAINKANLMPHLHFAWPVLKSHSAERTSGEAARVGRRTVNHGFDDTNRFEKEVEYAGRSSGVGCALGKPELSGPIAFR